MHRVIVYPGALPQEEDVLFTNKYAMLAEAFQNHATIGKNTAVFGLECLPTSPTADLHVTINVGGIFQMDTIDAAAYGDLGTDTSLNIPKMGTLDAPSILTITPPLTSGFSQVYLVQVELQDVDDGSVVLNYYNSNEPSQPYSGPANSGSSNYTVRKTNCTIGLKAGTSATTGTQVTPSADVGFTGLYAITVSNGQTQITSNNIVQLPSAPFFPTLTEVPYDVQQSNYTYAGQDTGTANTYVITFKAGQPIPPSYVAGLTVKFKALNSNTGASTINVNGLGAVAVRRGNGVALSANDIVSGGMVELTFDGTNFQMANYLGTGTNTNTVTLTSIPYTADTGSQNAIIATYSPAITSGQQVAGLVLEVKLANTITGACTINVSGLGVKPVTLGDGTNPPFNMFVAGENIFIAYDGTRYQIINTSAGMFYRRPTANYTIYVDSLLGSDTLYDGTSASVGAGTSGPLKTISKALLIAFGYAPSQFTITINIANGTYNESVTWPLYGGPNIIINGQSVAGVVVNGGAIGSAFFVRGPNTATIQNVTASAAAGNGSYCFVSVAGATVITQNTASNPCGPGVCVFGSVTATLLISGNHIFNGGANVLFLSANGGSLGIPSGISFTFSTSISVTQTAVAYACATITVATTNPATFINPSFVSGQRYFCYLNGIINANGPNSLGVNYFPGTTAGTVVLGGQVSF